MNLTEPPPSTGAVLPSISSETYTALQTLITVVLGGFFAIFGVAGNIINVIVFYRQGPMSNSSTVFLFALAVLDLGYCFFVTVSTCFWIILLFVDNNLYWSWSVYDFHSATIARPSNCIVAITTYVTTLLSFERAVSVAFPFKVKAIFTPKRCTAITVVITVLTVSMYTPDFFDIAGAWFLDEDTNTSYFGLYPAGIVPPLAYTVYYYINRVVLLSASMLTLVISNCIIAWKVKSSQKFRSRKANVEVSSHPDAESKSGESKSKQKQETHQSTKEIVLLRMLVVISTMFLISFLVAMTHVFVFYVIFDFGIDYTWEVEAIGYCVARLFTIVTASTNIIIYYCMSSQYREELKMCWRNKMI